MATVSAYREWVRQRKIMPKDDVVKLTARLISKGLDSIS